MRFIVAPDDVAAESDTGYGGFSSRHIGVAKEQRSGRKGRRGYGDNGQIDEGMV